MTGSGRSGSAVRDAFLGFWIDPAKRNIPLHIIGLYVALGVGWSYLCNVQKLLDNVQEFRRDVLFTIFTAAVLYWMISHGITVVRRKGDALRESDARLAGILATNPCGTIVVDKSGRLAFANAAAANIIGLHVSEMIGSAYDDRNWQITAPEGQPCPDDLLPSRRVLQKGQPIEDVEFAVRRADGQRIVLAVNAVPLRDFAGNLTGMVASFFDVTERKKAHDLMLRKLSLAVEQSPVGIVITGREGKVEYANPAFRRMTGYSREELTAVEGVCPTDTSPEICRQVCAAIAAGTEWRGEFQNRRRNGELYWESASFTPIRNADGEVTNFFWLRQDVSEHRKADEALRESRQKYQVLVETIDDCVWETDEGGAYSYVSPKVSDLLGYEPAEVVGKTPFDLMPEFEARRVSAHFAPIMAARQPLRPFENINVRKDGSYVILETTGAPVFDSDMTFRGYRGVDRDVTARKRAEDALRESEERFRQLFEQNEEPIILFKAGTNEIVDANMAAAGLFGFSREELIGGGPDLFMEPGSRDSVEFQAGSISEKTSLALDRVMMRRRDGERIIVSVRGKSIKLREGKVSFCTFRDITQRIRLEEEAKVRQAQLIHVNRMATLGTIVSGVAHEINNPNNLIMFNAPMVSAAWRDAVPVLEEYSSTNGDFALGGLPFSEMKEIVPKLIGGVSDASTRIKQIVNNLKDFARQGKTRNDDLLDVNEAVRTAVAILNHEILRGTSRFRVEPLDKPLLVRGDSQQIEQVVINLVTNSLHALPNNSCALRVSTSRSADGSMAEVRVEDEGLGMPAEVLTRVTEPFFSTKLDSGGLGLGLFICQSIISDHGGSLSFDSSPGKGTTACVALPLVNDYIEGNPGAALRA